MVIKARQVGTELKNIDLETNGVTTPSEHVRVGGCQGLGPGSSYEAKFNITVPLGKESHQLLSPSGYSLTEEEDDDNSLSNYSTGTSNQESSLNDSGVVGDHDQDSLSDNPSNIVQNDIINCEPKSTEEDRRPSKINIPFVVSIGEWRVYYYSN